MSHKSCPNRRLDDRIQSPSFMDLQSPASCVICPPKGTQSFGRPWNDHMPGTSDLRPQRHFPEKNYNASRNIILPKPLITSVDNHYRRTNLTGATQGTIKPESRQATKAGALERATKRSYGWTCCKGPKSHGWLVMHEPRILHVRITSSQNRCPKTVARINHLIVVYMLDRH